MSNPLPSGEAPEFQPETQPLFEQTLWDGRPQNPAPFSAEEAARLKQFWLDLFGSAFNPDHIRHVDGLLHVRLSPDTHLHISRTGVRVQGPVTDVAIGAGLQHVKATWGAVCYINPALDPATKLLAWQMAQDAGVTIANYAPSQELQAAYHAQKSAAVARRAEVFADATPAPAVVPPVEPAPVPPAPTATTAAPQEETFERTAIPPVHGPIQVHAVPDAVAPRRPASANGDIATRTTCPPGPCPPGLMTRPARPSAPPDIHP